MAELNSSGPMLMEILYLGFLFHCYSGPINVFRHMNYGYRLRRIANPTLVSVPDETFVSSIRIRQN